MKTVQLNGIDFLLMAQNGTLRINLGKDGTIEGINLDDFTVERFDGMLVALQSFSELLANTNYTVIIKENKTPAAEIEMNENNLDIEN